MLLGEAVMLFHRKIRRSKKYRALTDIFYRHFLHTDPLVIHNFEICIINRVYLGPMRGHSSALQANPLLIRREKEE